VIVCAGAVVLRDDRVLWVRQAEGHSLAGLWSIPWGIVDPGEASAEAALRETREEARVAAELQGLLVVQDLPEEDALGLAFLCRHLGGIPTPDGSEVDRAAYLSLTDMDALGEPLEPWCGWLVRRVLRGEYRILQRERH
jgi:ADP-ribose pyrophosphatase YjhB (NUDIX family)